MVNRSCLMVVFAVCFGAAGCHQPTRIADVAGDEGPSNELPEPVAIEVRETTYDSGEIATRKEGYVDSEGNFVLHGNVAQFWENGQQKSEDHYVHGIRNGKRTAWYDSGQVWQTGMVVDGREDGVWTVWYQTGKKAKESHYKNGAWHGLFTYWHPNGEKRSQVEFVMGKRQGKYLEWDEFGTMVRQIEYADDVPQP